MIQELMTALPRRERRSRQWLRRQPWQNAEPEAAAVPESCPRRLVTPRSRLRHAVDMPVISPSGSPLQGSFFSSDAVMQSLAPLAAHSGSLGALADACNKYRRPLARPRTTTSYLRESAQALHKNCQTHPLPFAHACPS